MNKMLLVVVALFLIIGCSEKKEELNPKKIDTNETNLTKSIKKSDTKDSNKTAKIEKEVVNDITTTKKNMMVIKEEFIPEHIRKSHIEVVEHY